jgi:TolA-binding protein
VDITKNCTRLILPIRSLGKSLQKAKYPTSYLFSTLSIGSNLLLVSLTAAIGFTGCSTAPAQKPNSSDPSNPPDHTAQLLNDLNNRLQTFEAKLNSMNDKIDSTRFSLEQMSHQRLSQTVGVTSHPADQNDAQTSEEPDSSSGFKHDEAVLKLRQAMILFEGQKYPEAVLSFSELLEKYPDHPLASSAQFYVAESYLMQKENKIALQEFQRVLNTYDRSPHIPDTLKEMALIEDQLKKEEDAAKHRQLLTSLFPQSPAALASLSSVKSESEKPEVPAPATAPAETPEHETSSHAPKSDGPASHTPTSEPSSVPEERKPSATEAGHLDPPPVHPQTAPLHSEPFQEHP